jgi:hypothetical protein
VIDRWPRLFTNNYQPADAELDITAKQARSDLVDWSTILSCVFILSVISELERIADAKERNRPHS